MKSLLAWSSGLLTCSPFKNFADQHNITQGHLLPITSKKIFVLHKILIYKAGGFYFPLNMSLFVKLYGEHFFRTD